MSIVILVVALVAVLYLFFFVVRSINRFLEWIKQELRGRNSCVPNFEDSNSKADSHTSSSHSPQPENYSFVGQDTKSQTHSQEEKPSRSQEPHPRFSQNQGEARSRETYTYTLPKSGDSAVRRLVSCKEEDPYVILGVDRDATDEEIKRNYKKTALLVHPDKNQDPAAGEAFKILGAAYDLIENETKRMAYERKIREEKEDEAAREEFEKCKEEFEEWLRKLHEAMEEARNTMLCNSCGGKHKRVPTQRSVRQGRYCRLCREYHRAFENELWAETVHEFSWISKFKYFACMEGGIFDITEWAMCNGYHIISEHADSHWVFFHLRSEPISPLSPRHEPGDGQVPRNRPQMRKDTKKPPSISIISSIWERLVNIITSIFKCIFITGTYFDSADPGAYFDPMRANRHGGHRSTSQQMTNLSADKDSASYPSSSSGKRRRRRRRKR